MFRKLTRKNNIVYVDDETGLYSRTFTTRDINLMLYEKLDAPVKATVKIRYKDEGSEAVIEQINDDCIKVIYTEPKKSITPGQSAVFCDGDKVIGGGIIDKVLES